MSASPGLASLHDKVAKLLEKSLCEIQGHPSQASQHCEGRFRAAEYLLIEAREYVDAAFNLLEAGKARASLSVSRWILEAALNFLWATVQPNEVNHRLRLLVAEALRLEAARLEGLASLYPGDANRLRTEVNARRKERVNLVGKGEPRLAPLEERLRSAIGSDQSVSYKELYALYRICCAAAHPNLAVWRRFGFGPDGARVTSAPPESTQIAVWMVAASTFHLVTGAYCLTNLGDAKSLKTWWEQEIAPLLGCQPSP